MRWLIFLVLLTFSISAASRDGGRASGGGRGSLGAADVDVVKEDESKSMGENARCGWVKISIIGSTKTIYIYVLTFICFVVTNLLDEKLV